MSIGRREHKFDIKFNLKNHCKNEKISKLRVGTWSRVKAQNKATPHFVT